MGTLHISLFGDARLSFEDRPLPEFPTRKARNLFFYLVLKRERLHPRDVLIGTFWGDSPEALARKRFRTTLWRVRSTLESVCIGGSAYIKCRGQGIGFDAESDHWLDIEAFQRGLSAAGEAEQTGDLRRATTCLDEAIRLYRGDLLEGLYHNWCVQEQQTLKALFLLALERKMNFAAAAAAWGSAVEIGHRLLRHDPLREHIHRNLIECLYWGGDRPAALRHYRHLEELLREELQVAPMVETRRLREAIRNESVPARPAASARAPAYDAFGDGRQRWVAGPTRRGETSPGRQRNATSEP